MLYTVLSVVHLVLFVIAAVEILGGSKPLGQKVLWLVLILLLPVIGLILYFVVGRR